MSGGEIRRESNQQRGPICSAGFSALLELHNLSARVPVGSGHDRIRGTNGKTACGRDQKVDASKQVLVPGHLGLGHGLH